MSVTRIGLDEDGDEVFDRETGRFLQTEVVLVRAKDREEANEIAEHVADKFGEKISFNNSSNSGDDSSE